MQLQFNKTALHFLGTAVQEVRNGEVTQDVRLSDGMPDIGRVLTTWGQILLRSKEWQGDQITLTGGVMIWTLYAPEDGTEPRSVESWIPFQLRWETERMDREGPVRIIPLLRFADSRSVSSRKMMVRAGIAAMAQGFYPMEEDVFSAGELPENVQVLKNTFPVRLPSEAGEKTFLIDDEITLPNLADPVEKLLSFTVNPKVTEKRVLTGKIAFKGAGNLHLVYRDQNGKVNNWEHELPFSQLAELERTHGTDTQVDIRMGVTSMEADINEPGKLRIKCGLVAQYLVDERHLLEVVQDAYSPLRSVEMEKTDLKLPVILDDRTEYITAEQSVPGVDGQVADAQFLPDFPRKRMNMDGIELEMPGLFQTLVYDENGSLQGYNPRWEGRSHIPADESADILAVSRPSGTVQSMMGTEGMMLSSQMQLQLQTVSQQGIPMVNGLELGELQEPEDARPSVILRRGNGETLWEIAKECGSTTSAISSANGLEREPAPDQMLLIPVC